MSDRFVIFMGVLLVVFAIVGIWMVVRPKKAARLKYYPALRKPDKDEPGDMAVGLARLSGILILFFVLIVVVSVLNPGTDSRDRDESPHEDTVQTLCRNWTDEEYEEVSDASEGQRDVVVPAAYQANRCSLSIGYGDEALTDALEFYLKSEVRPDHAGLYDFFVDFLTNKGLVSGWSSLCLTASDGDEARLVEIQKQLGRGLAVASRIDTHIDGENWTALRKLGNATVELRTYSPPERVDAGEHTEEFRVDQQGPTVVGWSVIAPLLRYGEFEHYFLAPIATAIVEFDERHQGSWTVPGEDWVSFDPKVKPTKTENAIEPVLEALVRNEEAAEKVAEETGDERVKKLLED